MNFSGETNAVNSAVHIWTTDSVDDKNRVGYWVDAVCAAFLSMDINTIQASNFRGRIDMTKLGCLGVSHVYTSPQHVIRSKKNIVRSDKDSFYLVSATDDWEVEQGHDKQVVLAGALAMVDVTRPYHFNFQKETLCTAVVMPTDWAKSWLVQPELLTGKMLDTSSGWGQVLGSFISQMTPQLVGQTTESSELLIEHLGMLLEMVEHSQFRRNEQIEAHSARSMNDIYKRAMNYLQENFSNPYVKASKVADEIGTSIRTLHRAFGIQNTTFATSLGILRIQAAQRMLANPNFDHLSIGEIGYRVGYVDPAHFARFLKSKLSIPPSALRKNRQIMT